MIAQDLTKFMIVTVLLGIVLALAVFRPEILPAEADQPTQVEETAPVPEQQDESASPLQEYPPLSEEEPEQHEPELDQR